MSLEISHSCRVLAKELLHSASRLSLLLKKVSVGIHASDPDASSEKWSEPLRSPSQTPTAEKRGSDQQCEMKNLVIDQSLAEKKISCDQPSSMDDDGIKSKGTRHARFGSSQPKIVLTTLRPEILQSLAKDGVLRYSRYLQVHHAPHTSSVQRKKIESPHRMVGKLVSQRKKKVHHAPCNYSSLQPKVVLTRKKHILESLSNHSSTEYTRCSQTCSQRTPVVEEIENESLSTMEKLVAQEKINANDFSLSKDNAYASSSSGDDSDDELDSKRSSPEEGTSFSEESCTSYETPKSKITSQARLVLTSMNGSSDRSRCSRAHHQPLHVEIEEADEDDLPLKKKRKSIRLVSQKRVNYFIPSSSEEDEDENNLIRSKAFQEDSSEDDSSSLEESNSSYESSRKKITSQAKFVLTSMNGSSDRSRCSRAHRQPLPIEIETDEDGLPLKKKRKSIRLVSQKRVNYFIPSSSEEDEDENKLVRRKAVRKASSEDNSSSLEESNSSCESCRKKIRRISVNMNRKARKILKSS